MFSTVTSPSAPCRLISSHCSQQGDEFGGLRVDCGHVWRGQRIKSDREAVNDAGWLQISGSPLIDRLLYFSEAGRQGCRQPPAPGILPLDTKSPRKHPSWSFAPARLARRRSWKTMSRTVRSAGRRCPGSRARSLLRKRERLRPSQRSPAPPSPLHQRPREPVRPRPRHRPLPREAASIPNRKTNVPRTAETHSRSTLWPTSRRPRSA